jgi:hypothetical protein
MDCTPVPEPPKLLTAGGCNQPSVSSITKAVGPPVSACKRTRDRK